MSILVTGAAGFIGYHVSQALLAQGERVIGVDSLNDYYDVHLKERRRDSLLRHNAFSFEHLDIADRDGVAALGEAHDDVTRVVHLAAQAGVRYSLENPFAYTHSNVLGHLVMLEFCRHLPALEHLVYASSSSVYGGNKKIPFSATDRTDTPISLYAATKKADEEMSHCYSHLYRLPATGLRFFTVYGPWGRPDMAAYIFARAISEGTPVRLFNNGDMKRDFTYIDDIVAGVVACLEKPPVDDGETAPHRVYNIGNNRPEPLVRFVEVIEQAMGKKAVIEHAPMQPGDVKESFADIADTQRDFGFVPKTPIDVGIPRFIEWYKDYHGV
ncbi:MAG: NAD-dependent epimerase/dehydratase family protein [Alphaproteobacteria bacterium]|nr:NAD-dependent epimerase/dehydratase family protein [Alphaproteobacteria bacterium]